MATRYHFVTRIELGADRQRIWEALADSSDWPRWWRWLESVEILDEGNGAGIGRRVRHVVSSPLRYRLTYTGVVTRASKPSMGRFEASGDLEGTGQFRLETTDSGSTLLTFDWLVMTPKSWMNYLAPLAKPVFVWSHHRLMEDFGAGLARATSSDLLGVTNDTLDPHQDGFFEMPAFES